MTARETVSFPIYPFAPSSWEDFQTGIKREWLISNGIGGFASSTIIGANTRSYHGLLIASLQPPVDRQVLLSKVEEEITFGGTTYQLSSNQYRDKNHPAGYQHLVSFVQDPFPTWFFSMEGIVLKKWIFMRQGENTTIIGYELLQAPNPIDFYVLFLVTKRNFHHLLRSDNRKFEQEKNINGTSIRLASSNNTPFLYLNASKGEYFRSGEWYYNFQYVREKERGLDFEEDVFHPGTFSIKLSPGEKIFLTASTALTEPVSVIKGKEWQAEEEARLQKIITDFPAPDPEARKLALAADVFIVKRNGSKSIIAGYPWFNDWGRDTFISIPGLLLVTGRAEEAKEILRAASRYLHNGLVPSNFPDSNGASPSYDSVDVSLWFIYSVYKTWEYSRDRNFVEEIFSTLTGIIEAYVKGTEFGIRMGKDFLIYADNPEEPLTWMDAKVGHWVVTPRSGAAVEVNALWYNALKIVEELSVLSPSSSGSIDYSRLASGTSASFADKFWNENDEALYDTLSSNGQDPSIRPNQILALGLPFSLLPKERERKVFKIVAERLYTPYGLRTLDPKDKNYKGVYQGDRWLRDGAYHQGTVWPWLLGPFCTAMVRMEGESGRPKVLDLLSPILAHLFEAGIGQISEIFWGDFPYQPAGCIAQAWSLAEILRAYVEEGLGIKP